MTFVPSRIALSEIDNDTLLTRLRQLVRRDSALTATILAHLGEVDERGLYRDEGHSSLFDYCTRGLGLSEGAAYKRTQAARVCRRHPDVLAAVGEGRLHLSAVCVLAAHLNDGNVVEFIASAAGLSKRDLEGLIHVRMRPPVLAAEAPPRVPAGAEQPVFDFARPAADAAAANDVPHPARRPTRPDHAAKAVRDVAKAPVSMRPLTVRTTPGLLTKLDKARALLAHAIPSGDTTEILERALDLLVAKLETARFGSSKATRRGPPQPSAKPRSNARRPAADSCKRSALKPNAQRKPRAPIPAADRRAVYERDEGCCTFIGDHGHRCRSRFALEIHHIQAVANGGPDDLPNLTLHCRRHNELEAEREGLAPPPNRRRQPIPGQAPEPRRPID